MHVLLRQLGKQVYAHKAILAARNSDYFRNMFCGNLRERSASEISLPDISHAGNTIVETFFL